MTERINSLRDATYSLADRFVSTILWLVFLIVLFLVLWYFSAHFGQGNFLDNAMGNLFATIIGVVAGVPVALWITTSHQKAQEKKEAESEYERDRESLDSVLIRVREELSTNSDRARNLDEALSQWNRSFDDLRQLWEWAKTISDALEFQARDDFVRMDARKYVLPVVENQIYSAYMMLKVLSHRVRQAHASYGYLHGIGPVKEPELRKELEIVRGMSLATRQSIESAIECLRENEGKYRIPGQAK